MEQPFIPVWLVFCDASHDGCQPLLVSLTVFLYIIKICCLNRVSLSSQLGNTSFSHEAIKWDFYPFVSRVIAVFNNMRTLKFKAQLTIGFFAAVSHNYGDSQRTS